MACCEPTERWLRTELRTTLVLRSSPVGPGFSAALAAHGRRDRASQTLSALFAARASPTEQPGLSLGLGAFVQPPNFPWPWTQNFARRGSSLDGGGAKVKSGCRSEKCGKGRQFDSWRARDHARTRLFSRLPLIARNSQHLIWQRRHRSPLTADGYACARRGRGLATTAGPAVTAAYFAAAAFAAAAAARCDPDARRAVRHAGTAALPLR